MVPSILKVHSCEAGLSLSWFLSHPAFSWWGLQITFGTIHLQREQLSNLWLLQLFAGWTVIDRGASAEDRCSILGNTVPVIVCKPVYFYMCFFFYVESVVDSSMMRTWVKPQHQTSNRSIFKHHQCNYKTRYLLWSTNWGALNLYLSIVCKITSLYCIQTKL